MVIFIIVLIILEAVLLISLKNKIQTMHTEYTIVETERDIALEKIKELQIEIEKQRNLNEIVEEAEVKIAKKRGRKKKGE